MAETGTRIRIKKPWVTHEPEGPERRRSTQPHDRSRREER